jgi:uncharacterized protein (DUF488 family)
VTTITPGPILYSIGHSNHSPARFLELLRAAGIGLVVDVRSVPASRYVPAYTREAMRDWLAQGGIGYRWLGQQLGGKPRDAALLTGGRTDYAKVTASADFQAGIATLLEIAAAQPLAMMCAERDPADCHRTHLVTPALTTRGADVRHILADGGIEPDAALRQRLAPRQPDLFG